VPEVAREHALQGLEQRQLFRRRVDIAQGVLELRRLAGDRLAELGVRVAERGGTEAGNQIDVPIAIDIPDIGPGPALPEDGWLEQAGDLRALDPRQARRVGPRRPSGRLGRS
jgi:hypothetical protein